MDVDNANGSGHQKSKIWNAADKIVNWIPGPIVNAMSRWLGYNKTMNGAAEASSLDRSLPMPHPNLFMGSLSEAIAYSKASMKFLVIYLHSEMHQDTPTFVTTVLQNQVIIDVLNQNFVFWGGDISHMGPNQVSHQLGVSGFPAVLIYCSLNFVPRSLASQLEGQPPFSLFLLDSTCNNTDWEDIAARLASTVERYSGWIEAARRTQQQRAQNRALMEEQDSEYLRALAEDERIAREEAEAAETERRIQAEALRIQEDEARQAEEALRQAQEARNAATARIPSEPPEGEGVISVTFRNVDSSRTQRRFRQTDTVQALYDFVYSLDSSPNSFTLASPYPRQIYDQRDRVLSTLNLHRAVLSVEPM